MTPASITLDCGRAFLSDLSGAFALADGDPRDPEMGFVGNPMYMSPEMIDLECEIDSRTDIYSLGVLIYEILAGAPPFMGRTSIYIGKEILEQPPPALLDFRPGLPLRVQELVEKALAKDPADRYQSALDLRCALDELTPPHPPGSWWRRLWWYLERTLKPSPR
jgi:serine/threonine protein kinase